MGWSGSLSASSAVGSAITYTPDTSGERGYTVGTFTAPKKGVYRFQLKGSGGKVFAYDGKNGTGGAGGSTDGYLLLEANQTVYVGAGGPLSAAFVAKATGGNLAAIAKANLYFVAGGGGGGGAQWGNSVNYYGGGPGGNGGGSSGAAGTTQMTEYGCYGGSGGTQSSGAAYGTGANGTYGNSYDTSSYGGYGGDGLYGGYAGASMGAGGAGGGGGGSGYVYSSSLTVNGKTYASSTAQGGGAASASRGSVVVTYYAQVELPVIFNGTTLTELIYNGTKITSLIYNGTKLFFERLRRRWRGCLSSAAPESA